MVCEQIRKLSLVVPKLVNDSKNSSGRNLVDRLDAGDISQR